MPEELIGNWPIVTEQDKKALLEFIDSENFGVKGKKSEGEMLAQEWAQYLGVKHCLSTNSGTAALHMAIAAADIGPGDEVIIPAFTFWASAAAVLHQNAIPVFVDIEPSTFCIDPEKIEEKITERTRAIMPVHIHGMPADMDPINQIAKKHNLVVIEDACQAHGAKYKGKKVGALSDMAAFSLECSKPLSSSSEGGLFVTDNPEYHEKAALLRQFGEIVIKGKAREYNAYGLGWNYRMHQLGAVFARSQLKRLDEYTRMRVKCCEYVTKELNKIQGIKPPFTPPDREPVYFAYVLDFCPEEVGLEINARDFRDGMENALRAEGVPVSRWQTRPVPAQAVLLNKTGYGKGCPWNCPNYHNDIEYRAEDYPETLKFLDSHSYLGGKLVPIDMQLADCYLEAFRKVFASVDRVVGMIEKVKQAL